MKTTRAIISGIFIWILIFISFSIMSYIPIIKDSDIQQSLIVNLLLIPIVILGAKFYYKSGEITNGLLLGIFMSIIGLILDGLITVPFVIVPHGGNFRSFFINPLFLITLIEYIVIVYFYWNKKVRK